MDSDILGPLGGHELLEARPSAGRTFDELEVAFLGGSLDGPTNGLLASGGGLCCVSLSRLLGLCSL